MVNCRFIIATPNTVKVLILRFLIFKISAKSFCFPLITNLKADETESTRDQMLYFGIIADQIHTHPAALHLAYQAHPRGLCLVTDAMSAMGLEDARVHHIGDMTVEIVHEQSPYAADGTTRRCAYIQVFLKFILIRKYSTRTFA